MTEEDAPASAGDLLRALAPGATSPKTLLLALATLVGVFLVLWWVPVAVVWGVAPSLLG